MNVIILMEKESYITSTCCTRNPPELITIQAKLIDNYRIAVVLFLTDRTFMSARQQEEPSAGSLSALA